MISASLQGFFDELDKIAAMGMDLRRLGDAGIKRPAFPTEGSKGLASKLFKKRRQVGQATTGQPAAKSLTPNIRAVASMPR